MDPAPDYRLQFSPLMRSVADLRAWRQEPTYCHVATFEHMGMPGRQISPDGGMLLVWRCPAKQVITDIDKEHAHWSVTVSVKAADASLCPKHSMWLDTVTPDVQVVVEGPSDADKDPPVSR